MSKCPEEKGRWWDFIGGQTEGKQWWNEGRESLKPEGGKSGGEGRGERKP